MSLEVVSDLLEVVQFLAAAVASVPAVLQAAATAVATAAYHHLLVQFLAVAPMVPV